MSGRLGVIDHCGFDLLDRIGCTGLYKPRRDASVIKAVSLFCEGAIGLEQRLLGTLTGREGFGSDVNALLSLPEGQLGDLFLGLPPRQADIVDQMRIVLRHLLEVPAKAYLLTPGRDPTAQARHAVAPRHIRRRSERSRLRCPMPGRRKNIVHGNLHIGRGPGALDLKEVEFCGMRTAA